MEISAKTKLLGLIGHPVEHSFSPYIHNYLAEKTGIDFKYVAFDVETDKVIDAVKGIQALGISGCNVTIPHKVEVMKSLDKIDKNAAIIGAVNTIKNCNGKLTGYNTDGIGFINSVLNEDHIIKGKQAMVLGAGGASRAICVYLAANNVNRLIIRNHTVSKAKALADEIKNNFKEVIVEYGSLELKQGELTNIDFLINTTPLGMSSNKNLCPINKEIVPPPSLVACDIVYTPYETEFLKWAKLNGLKRVHGIGMLINQALESFHIWTGIDVSDSYDEILELLKQKKIVG